MTIQTKTLATVLHEVRAEPLPKPALARMTQTKDAISRQLRDAIDTAIPAFSTSRNPELRNDLEKHTQDLTSEFLQLIKGGKPDTFEFVRTFAKKRADQRFPLEATLQVYHTAHKVLEGWLVEALKTTRAEEATAADLTQAIVNEAITTAASAYVAETRILTEVAGDQRTKLLTMLLEGYDESDPRLAEFLRSAGYVSTRHCYCVVLARAVDPSEMQNPARARRMLDAIDRVAQDAGFQRLADVRDNRVALVCSALSRKSGWTPHQVELANRLTSELAVVGPAALIGVSNDVRATSQIPAAYRQAQLALEFANVGRRVVSYSVIGFQRLLLHLAGDELQRMLPAWTESFFAADTKARGTLATTLQAYADADMNVIRTAETLKVHPNTIYARFDRITGITGLHPRTFQDLSELLLVAKCRA